MMKKTFDFIKKNNLQINVKYLDFFSHNELLDFEKLWNLSDSFFYYEKRYRIIEGYDLGEVKLYLKKYNDNLEEAEQEWKNISLLWSKSIPTLIPLIFGKKENRAIVGTKELKAPSSLTLIKDNLISPEILLLKLSRFLAYFHDHHLFHRDCYIGHFHYDVKADIFYVMDVARVKYKPSFELKFLIKDLSQFKYSLLEIFKKETAYWWDLFWNEYNKARKKRLGKFVKFLINKKAYLIERHTMKVIRKGGENVVMIYKNKN